MGASAGLPDPDLHATEDGNIEPLGYSDENPLFHDILESGAAGLESSACRDHSS
jgi:hypothetical protein